MEINHVLGFAGAFLTGLTLGVLGGGGALFSIPVLVYLFDINPTTATGYSMFLIGITALSGAARNIKKGNVDYNSILYYGVPSIVAVYCVRRFLIPNIPDVLFAVNHYQFTKDQLVLLLLVNVMFIAGYKMIMAKPITDEDAQVKKSVDYVQVILLALLIGAFLGMVGAGGGFLMTPVLVFYAHMPIKRAISTSIVLVAINSFMGFLGDIHSNQSMDWQFLAVFSGFSIAGVVWGASLHDSLDSEKMRRYFGWFMMAAALSIVMKEVYLR